MSAIDQGLHPAVLQGAPADLKAAPGHRRSRLKQEEREFRRMFLATYVFFLAAALVARLLPPSLRPFPAAPGRRTSVFGDARRAAYATIPFAFMG